MGMTECNYCTLKKMKERAKQRNAHVVMGSDHGWITARYSYEGQPSAFFLELTEKCAC